ncbi:MAG: GNAT family N-acetyltransferase [Oscillospiraceae bacterium]
MNFKFEPNRIFCESEDHSLLAEITFPEIQKGLFCINHTFVDTSLRGQGVANQLMELAVKEIKNHNGKMVATCSYAQRWLEKHDQ